MISPNNNTKALLALVLAGFLPGSILARECHATPNSSSNVNSNALIVSTPDDLSIFHGCTSILGDILIGSAYTGSFGLNGVETITGSVSTEDSDSDLSGLTAIEMPDLLYTESISLPRSRELMNLHLPRLKHIKNLSFTQGIEDASFDLGSLETADEISMTGYWSSVSLPSLETINSLTITDLRLSRRTADIDTDHSNPLTISLPSLTEAHHIRTNGLQTRPRISSPLLEAGIINPQLSIGVEDKYKDKNNFNPLNPLSATNHKRHHRTLTPRSYRNNGYPSIPVAVWVCIPLFVAIGCFAAICVCISCSKTRAEDVERGAGTGTQSAGRGTQRANGGDQSAQWEWQQEQLQLQQGQDGRRYQGSGLGMEIQEVDEAPPPYSAVAPR